MIDVCVTTKAVLYGVKTTAKQWIQPPTILPLHHPDVTECARSSEIQIQVTSASQTSHKHALVTRIKCRFAIYNAWAFPVSLSPLHYQGLINSYKPLTLLILKFFYLMV